MNARVMAPSAIHEFIFGDQLLHSRFSMAIELLARIVIANPHPVTIGALSEALGQPPRSVRALLATLHQSGLLSEDEKNRGAWYCSSSLGAITLADIFRSVSGAKPESSSLRKKKSEEPAAGESRSSEQQSVDLLLMQATMAINQVVLQHLQAFDLGRLKVLASTNSFRTFSSSVRSYIPEPV
jgi:DNA-binding IscR family transcriptional regulator